MLAAASKHRLASTLTDVGRLWRTVRWLKFQQLVGRVRARFLQPPPNLKPAPARRAIAGTWVASAARESSLVGPTCMRFLNVVHDLAVVGWDDPEVPLLWRYNQHYFDDLTADRAVDRRDWQRSLIQRWCDQNPPGSGTGWAPYPTSLRIVNWIKWAMQGESLQPQWVDSLAVQARWLGRRLEWHLMGNHLFANAKALVFAGLFFAGPEAERWMTTGVRLLQRLVPEQILSDGGHFERSPLYHALALEDLLDLLNLIGAVDRTSPASHLIAPLRERAAAMLHWMRCLQHPDRTLARFNDCAEGIAPSGEQLERYAAALGISARTAAGEGVWVMEESGYVRVERGRAIALLDVAPVGPDHQPGHAHADSLSFELSIAGRQLVVNRGTSVYDVGSRRQWERGTAAHSTVQIGDVDSSEVWAGFRVGRRARPGPLRRDGWSVECSHDGYAHLPEAPRHYRRWTFEATGLRVEDRVEPTSRDPAVARFHLAPGLNLVAAQGSPWDVIDGQRSLARIDVPPGSVVEATLHAQGFGRLEEARTLIVPLSNGRASVRIDWED
jgi:uncharacterized heparinase superfamily protein